MVTVLFMNHVTVTVSHLQNRWLKPVKIGLKPVKIGLKPVTVSNVQNRWLKLVFTQFLPVSTSFFPQFLPVKTSKTGRNGYKLVQTAILFN